ncbi:GNAT family N-acetyltransferase [Paenibacillus sp. GCM10012306]|uniref:GNAT family N-acetyltransferase n=1 Tax=Paenibacillus sp. GCM10012306 TaxID=3317342 RepID=UPI00361A4989
MVIRILNANDAEVYQKLRLRALKDHPEAFLSSYEDEKDMPLGMVETRLQPDQDKFTLGAFNDNGELVGMVTFIRENREKVKHKGLVVAVYVSPEARKLRLGFALMQELIARAAQLEGVEILNLAVMSGNEAAVKLYESLGFTSYGKEKKAVKIGDTYYDDEHMSLDLNERRTV